MIDPDEMQLVKSTANELNNLLHVISESSQALESLGPSRPETDKYFAMLRSALERAKKVTGQMVQRMGGVAAEGTTTAPAAAPEPRPVGKRARDIQIFNSESPRELLMVVDDEEVITALAQEVLAEAGYRVLTAKDGFEALDLYREMHSEIALILLDFTMPVMDGADVFHEIRQINPAAAVVLSSGFTEQDRLRGLVARGLRGFIPKPYTKQKLLEQVGAILGAIATEKAAKPV
jgi:CheY-like chemotaxis protein